MSASACAGSYRIVPRRPGVLALHLAFLVAAQGGARASADVDPMAAAGIAERPPEATSIDLYLEVSIDGQRTHTIVSFAKRSTDVCIRPKDLESLGVDLVKLETSLRSAGMIPSPMKSDPASRAAENVPIRLEDIPGLRYRIDEAHQSIDLSIPDALRSPFMLGRENRPPPAASSGAGLVFNYDVLAQRAAAWDARPSLTLSGEQRLFGTLGVLTNTGIASTLDEVGHYVRQSTTYRYDEPNSLTALQLGDVLSSSLSWTRPVRLGGVELSRDFALRPDLITFPVPQLAGSAALPSTVDLYVNSVHQLTGDVPSGPFILNAPGITGGGLATVLVRDPLGRTVSTTLPIYVDSRLLAPGLSSYSVESGFLRYDYGVRSFDYAGRPALSATWRYGASAETTWEAHAESTPRLVDAGAGALLKLGNAGVLNLSLSASDDTSHTLPGGAYSTQAWSPYSLPPSNPGTPPAAASPTARLIAPTQGSGAEVGIGYQFIEPAFSVTASSTRALSRYADLAAVSGTPAPRRLDQLTISLPLGAEHTVGSSFVHVDDAVAGRSALASVWYSAPATRSVSAFVNVSRDLDQARSTSVTVGLSADFGNRLSGFASGGSTDEHGSLDASIARSADYGGGWEWQAQANRNESGMNSYARGGYLGHAGEITVSAQQAGGQVNLALEDVGGLLIMDGVVEPSRRIGAGFALVSTDGVSDVPVLHENRVLGVTDSSGHLLVPDLNAYTHNEVAIDALSLPAGYKIPVERLDITPRADSGVLARFAIERYTAASLILVDDTGKFLPAGTVVHHVESGRDFTVGYDGIAFIEDLAARNHLEALVNDHACVAQFGFEPPNPADGAPADAGVLAELGRVECIGDPGPTL